MNKKKMLFRQSVSGFSPLDLNPVVYIRGWEGVNETLGVVSSLNDLTGNGYGFTGVNSPTVEVSGINGLQSVRFDGSNYLQNLATITQITDLTTRFYWCVFEIEVANSGSSYHNISIMGVNSFASPGSAFSHTFNPNSSSFNSNFTGSTLDSNIVQTQLESKYLIINKTPTDVDFTLNNMTVNKVGTTNVNNANIFLGNWGGNGAKMLFSEFGILKDTPTAQEIIDLKQYFTDTYNL